MEYTNVIRRKLISLVEYSKELSPFKDYSFGQYVGNYFIKRTGERLIQLIVENMVDINSVVISKLIEMVNVYIKHINHFINRLG